ncbi:hypothetical protein NE279_14610 [Enterococcus faecium]|uniref:hypothetical protein n=1 Tax=Enterococcus faecium TaxID=1352 RepID=UPI002074804A|nr:hypothetical protein [Enterococcus faecium]MCM6924687.1 hypothetical protein [Enterococcus faecium]
MKKLGFILLLVSLFLVGCTSPSKENSDPSATTDKSSIIHVIHYPAGTPIAPYDAGSAVYPKDVVMLTGKYSYQGVLVYSSNHDGTITSYPVPSHWQMPADQTSYPAFIRETTQEIIDNASVVAIPTGNPNDVKQLINVIVMDN